MQMTMENVHGLPWVNNKMYDIFVYNH